MQTPVRRKTSTQTPVPILADNALAKKVMDEIARIDDEAKQKKLAQLESLQQARTNIVKRQNELHHQLEQIGKAIAAITGKHVAVPLKGEKRIRRNLDEVRERVGRWMEGRKGQKFAAGDLIKEFPELEGTPISYFMKPLVETEKVKTDTSEGVRRTKYFVAGE